MGAACAGGQSEANELRAAPHIRKALGPKHLLMDIPFTGQYRLVIRLYVCFS